MTKLPLPPLPLPSIDTWPNTPEKLRARDQEIVRCVLQAAAKVAEGDPTIGFDRNFAIAGAIRALEFTHHE